MLSRPIFFCLAAFHACLCASSSPAMMYSTHVSTEGGLKYDTSRSSISSIVDSVTSSAKGQDAEVVFFVLESRTKASDSLTLLASTGVLPKVREAFEGGSLVSPSSSTLALVTSYVSGGVNVANLKSYLKQTKAFTKVVTVSLTSLKPETLEMGRAVVVNVGKNEDPAVIDEVISSLMTSPSASSPEKKRIVVVCAEQKEVKAIKRRLEEKQVDLDSLYYVLITPNILAGVLFMLLFFFVTMIGYSCMNDIEGQTAFVSKAPPVGREC